MLIMMLLMFMMSLFKVGVTADMGISIDGGEEYREGVLTITEVNPNSKGKKNGDQRAGKFRHEKETKCESDE